jgi:hypothetical protein
MVLNEEHRPDGLFLAPFFALSAQVVPFAIIGPRKNEIGKGAI